MMEGRLAILLLAIVTGLSAALKIKITEPTGKSVWKTHSDVDVLWRTLDLNDTGIKTIEIDLWRGGKRDGKSKWRKPDLVRNICFGMAYDHGDSFWTVDPALEAGEDYYLKVTSPEDPDFVAESDYFEIAKGSEKDAGRMKISRSGEKSWASRSAFYSVALATALATISIIINY